MAIAGSLTSPKETIAVLGKPQNICHVDPSIRLLRENYMRLAATRIRNRQFQNICHASKPLDREPLAVRQPLDARNQNLLVASNIHRASLSSCEWLYQHACHWVGLASPWISVRFIFDQIFDIVLNRVFRHRVLIEFKIRNRGRVRCPPISRANLQLLRIHPIQLALSQSFASACRHRPRVSTARAHNPHVVIAHETYPAAVRRYLLVRQHFFSRDKRARSLRFQIEPDYRGLPTEQHCSSVRRELKRRRRTPRRSGSLPQRIGL